MEFRFRLVIQSCPTLCDPMNRSTPGLPVLHHLPEFAQTHVYWVNIIQPSHPLSPPSPPAFNLSQHQSFPMSQVFTWGGQSIGASASVLPMNIQGWFPLGLTGLMSLQSKGLSRVFSNTTVVKYQFSGSQPCLWSNSHIHTWLLEIPQLLLYGPLDMAACSQLKLRTLLHVGLWSTLFIVHLYNWYADIIWLQNVSCSNIGLIFLAYQDRWWEKNS